LVFLPASLRLATLSPKGGGLALKKSIQRIYLRGSNSKYVDLTSLPLGPKPDVAVGMTVFSSNQASDLSGLAYSSDIKLDGSGFYLWLNAAKYRTITHAECGWFGFRGDDKFRTGT